MFLGKKILLGITGSIAAYKTPELTRILIKSGAQVRIIMTSDAKKFVSPLTLSVLSKNPVYDDLFSSKEVNHVTLGLWADIMIIAPVTAHTLAKIATGFCDNMLMAVYLSAKCDVYIAPAMDLDMYKHATIKKNIEIIRSFGNKIIPATFGELASGLQGEGRMAEPIDIFKRIESDLAHSLSFTQKKVLITAGPTYEAIDPVRFIGNHSSGKMGFELALKFANSGAEVILISGRVSLSLEHKNIKRINVTSADQMYQQVHKYFDKCNIAILSAAVSDYKPKVVASDKIKKSDEVLTLELIKNKDILASLGKIKKHQILIGFALETQNEIAHAKNKLKDKNLDAIILNSLSQGSGFGGNTNKISIISKQSKILEYPLKNKREVASDIVEFINILVT